jgi:hypothetical protein
MIDEGVTGVVCPKTHRAARILRAHLRGRPGEALKQCRRNWSIRNEVLLLCIVAVKRVLHELPVDPRSESIHLARLRGVLPASRDCRPSHVPRL